MSHEVKLITLCDSWVSIRSLKDDVTGYRLALERRVKPVGFKVSIGRYLLWMQIVESDHRGPGGQCCSSLLCLLPSLSIWLSVFADTFHSACVNKMLLPWALPPPQLSFICPLCLQPSSLLLPFPPACVPSPQPRWVPLNPCPCCAGVLSGLHSSCVACRQERGRRTASRSGSTDRLSQCSPQLVSSLSFVLWNTIQALFGFYTTSALLHENSPFLCSWTMHAFPLSSGH